MATVTAVLTYTAASATPTGASTDEAKVTSFTWAGTAFASMTGAQLAQAREMLTAAVKLVETGGDATAREGLRSGSAARQPTS